ncbi:AAA family ATPase [Lentzea tibetensis]|uniref:AAA family ATPase n=1 Tax=Lentzea tibetensis TaxID=2591470 RepID=A0A563ERQ4_9PSEU|nr:ATP-binding protein [Lentzea tibetensis]TWP50218.1 AAA family ATPase [Lentzea tibetensis]
MLRSFRLGNHRSFRDEQELLLMPAYSKDRLALPVAAIYGANASGKSNLLDGLRFMAEAVRDSFASWRPEGRIPLDPFRFVSAQDPPSVFVVELVLEGVRYTYGFEMSHRRVLEEWLYSYPEKRKRVLFERNGDEVKFGTSMPDRAKLDVLVKLLRPNSLLLSLAAQSNVAQVLPVFRWFTSAVWFRFAGEEPLSEEDIAEHFAGDSPMSKQLIDLVRAADFGISNVTVHAPHPQEDDGRPRVVVQHGGHSKLLWLGEESAGTRSWFGLLPTALTVLRDGGVLLIDEIDASLHPLLAGRLVGLFKDLSTNPSGAQLIFTTHDATLLHPPLAEELLARDEIWFVEKDSATGVSRLYSLVDFKPRSEDNLERRYLAGRYGAVPELFEDRFAEAVRSADGEA